jgi:sulfite reductase beta subunit-like hemoprotein
LSSTLPRKFKIAFEGCSEDHTQLPINDIGFQARVEGGEAGFRVTVGGGTSTVCASGTVLFEWLAAREIFDVAEAVIQVFHKFGDRQHRQRNRMKFLIRELGWEAFQTRVRETLAAVRERGGTPLTFDPRHSPVEEPPRGPRPTPPGVAETANRARATAIRGPGIVPDVVPLEEITEVAWARWVRTNTRPQKQEGYQRVTVRLVLGDVTGAQLRTLADLASAYADGIVRVTLSQNIVLRWIRRDEVRELYRRLAAAGLGTPDADTVADVTSCPGAETCRLAVTQSRGLGQLLSTHLRDRSDWLAAAPDLRIKISGCPNGCGQHHVAGIGFQGSVRRLGTRVVPQYFVLIGGGANGHGTHFGRLAAKIPARRIPAAVDALLGLFVAERISDETSTAFFQRVNLARAKAVLAPFESLREGDAMPEDFVDLGETTAFKPEVQEGECAS